MITSLTDEQKSRFKEFVDKWIKIGLSTEPADRPRAEKAIKGLYALAKLDEPKIVWLPCPISAMLSAITFSMAKSNVKIDTQIKRAVEAAVKDTVTPEVRQNIQAAVRSALDQSSDITPQTNSSSARNAGYSYFGGSMWNAGYSAWADYFNEVCGIKIDRNFLDATESCGFYWTLSGICFASERPSQINLDDRGRLHSETGMSISYDGSGWGFYHWHGTKVPAEWITDRASLKPAVALKQDNVELRRAACEIIGWAKILKELKAKTIDEDADPEIGKLVEVKLPGLTTPSKFLMVRCGTKREFAMGIPPNINKAVDAQAWMVGLDPKDYEIPEVRT